MSTHGKLVTVLVFLVVLAPGISAQNPLATFGGDGNLQWHLPSILNEEPYSISAMTFASQPNLTPNHRPIVIVGDDNFTPENGVIAGSGTKDDPYVIANWTISPDSTKKKIAVDLAHGENDKYLTGSIVDANTNETLALGIIPTMSWFEWAYFGDPSKAESLNAEWLADEITYESLKDVDILIIGQPTLPLSQEEIDAIAQWLSDGGRILWVAGDSDYGNGNYTQEYVNNILGQIGSKLRLDLASVEDPVSNAGRGYRVVAFVDPDSGTPYKSLLLQGFTEGGRVIYHGPGVVAWVDGNGTWHPLVEGDIPSNVYRIVKTSENGTIVENTNPQAHVYSVGETGVFTLLAAERTGNNTIIVSGESPYGDFMPTWSPTFHGVDLDGPQFVQNMISWAIKVTTGELYLPQLGQPAIYIANTTKYFVIRNVTIYNGYVGIILDNVSNFKIEDSKFHDIGYLSIGAGFITKRSAYKTKATDGVIRGNEFWDIDTGILVFGSNFMIEDNYIHDTKIVAGNSHDAIVVLSNNTIVRNNRIEGIHVTSDNSTTHYGFGFGIVVELSNNVSIYNNTITNMTTMEGEVYAVFVDYSTNLRIFNNSIGTIDDYAIFTDYSTNLRIFNNSIGNIDDYAIILYEGTKNVLVENNEAWDVDSFIWATGTNFTIESNYIHDLEAKSGSATIGIGIAANNSLIRDNIIEDMNGRQKTYADGVLVISSAENVTIQNNTIRNIYNITYGEGIVLYTTNANSALDKIQIIGNHVDEVSDNGIDIDGHNGGTIDQIMVKNNNVSNCYWRSVLVYYTHGNITIANNTLSDNEHHGIGIEHSSNITVMNNEIYNNGEIGIHLLNSTAIRITNSDTHNNLQGIWIEDSSKVVLDNNLIHLNSLGVAILNSENMTMKSNRLEDNEHNLGIWAYTNVEGYLHHIDTSNTIDGRPIYYWVRVENAEIPQNASFVGLINCRNITGENLQLEHDGRILVVNSTDVYVRDSLLRNSGFPVDIVLSNGIVFRNVIFKNAEKSAVSVFSSVNVTLTNITVGSAGLDGIYLNNVTESSITESEVYNCTNGINIHYSNNNIIQSNTIHHNGFAGILSGRGSNATLRDNVIFLNNASGIEVWEGSHLQIINATVYNNFHAGIWVIDPGTFALIENSTVYENAWGGIEFHDGGYGVVKSSRIFNNSIDGIYIANTANVTIIESNISDNNASGLAVDNSHCITVVHSIFESNRDNGIKMYNVSNASIQESIFRDNRNLAGIWIDQVLNSAISNNFFEDNRIGLGLGYANGNTIRGNTFLEDGVFVWYQSTNTFENNTVNGKPILYYENPHDITFTNNNIGQLILMNPVNVTVKNLNISDVAIGIELVGGHDNKVIDNYLLDTWDGINIRYSHNIKVQNNTLVRNGWIFLRKATNSEIVDNYINGTDSGVFMTEGSEYNIIKNNWISSSNCPFVILESNHNAIYLNSIYGDKAYIRNSSVIWKSPAPLEYIYKNQTLTGYLGNYWSNYNGTDMNNDGIGDSPWFIDSENADEYPLTSPADEYKIKAIKTDFIMYVRTRDSKVLKIWPSGFVQETPFYDSSHSLEIMGDRLYTQNWMYYGRAIKVYDLKNESLITTIPVPEGVSGLTFAAIPGGRIAFLNNAEDRVYIISPNGTLLANISIKEQPDNHLQVMDGIVVENKLIISEDGDKNIIAIDLRTYEKTIFKNLSYVPWWLGSITYHNGTFYVASSRTIYQFTENSNATPLVVLPEGNIVGITTFGRYLYAAVNFGGKVYRIDLQTKEYKVVADNLNYPTDLELWAILQSEKIRGDVNGDGEINAVDALLYLKFAVGLDISPYHLNPQFDDLTGDGKITVADALKVLRVAVGLEVI